MDKAVIFCFILCFCVGAVNLQKINGKQKNLTTRRPARTTTLRASIPKTPTQQRSCGVPFNLKKAPDSDAIQQHPWSVSLGRYENGSWVVECSGSLVSNKHVLTAASCLENLQNDTIRKGYLIRFGPSDVDSSDIVEMQVVQVLTHPQYQPPAAYFDVGIAVVENEIQLGERIRTVCLPFNPVNQEEVALAGWQFDQSKNLTMLKLKHVQQPSHENCEELLQDKTKFPTGFKEHFTCLGNYTTGDNVCGVSHRGAPGVISVRESARGPYCEQQYVLTSGLDCNTSSLMTFVNIASFPVINWIHNATDTMPSIMVVAGGSDPSYLNSKSTLAEAELLTAGSDGNCKGTLNEPVGYIVDGRNGETSAAVEGAVGYFANEAAIICGGKNLKRESKDCYQYLPEDNKWKNISSMNKVRYSAASTVDEHGNFWVLGGYESLSKNSESTEIYNFAKNKWTLEDSSLPPELLKISIQDQCVVRINSTHVFMAGGLSNTLAVNSQYVGGSFYNKAWIFDGKDWNSIRNMSIVRDDPACSLIEMNDGEIGILVTSGCEDWCYAKEASKRTEIYNLKTGRWEDGGDLPARLSGGHLVTFEGVPTFVGGYDDDRSTTSQILYQYNFKAKTWKAHPKVTLKIPRYEAAVFTVPKDFINIC